MKYWSVIGTGLLTLGSLTSGALAVGTTKADIDACNQKAAQATQTGQNNPTGGRLTDSSQPGVPPSELGMAAIGETNPAYRQAYLACIAGINAAPAQPGAGGQPATPPSTGMQTDPSKPWGAG